MIYIHPKDLDKNQVILVRRDSNMKYEVKFDNLSNKVKEILNEIQEDLFNKAKKLALRKRVLMTNYIERAMPRPVKLPLWDLNLKTSVLNTEEIATLFHPPTSVVKSGELQSIQSKKGIAPTDLPTKEI